MSFGLKSFAHENTSTTRKRESQRIPTHSLARRARNHRKFQAKNLEVPPEGEGDARRQGQFVGWVQQTSNSGWGVARVSMHGSPTP